MKPSQVSIRELAAWGLDESPRGDIHPSSAEYRSLIEDARRRIEERTVYEAGDAILHDLTASERSRYSSYLECSAMRAEYVGLRWTIAVVDLHKLIAFQRRIFLDTEQQHDAMENNWDHLAHLAFCGTRGTAIHRLQRQSAGGVEEYELLSWNPDLQLRVDPAADQPFHLYAGSPFFEVAHYRGRWFLRDGYHRAFRLLQAGIHAMFAIVVDARNMAEVGAVQPWFFDEKALFSEHPPMVTDFHDDSLVLRYKRARMVKRLTLRIEETLVPADGCVTIRPAEEKR